MHIDGRRHASTRQFPTTTQPPSRAPAIDALSVPRAATETIGRFEAPTIAPTFLIQQTPEKLISATNQILPLFVERGYSTGLSTALVRTLEKLKQSDQNSAALERWELHGKTLLATNGIKRPGRTQPQPIVGGD